MGEEVTTTNTEITTSLSSNEGKDSVETIITTHYDQNQEDQVSVRIEDKSILSAPEIIILDEEKEVVKEKEEEKNSPQNENAVNNDAINPTLVVKSTVKGGVDPRGPYAGDAKLFVANLPFKITAQELEELFSKYGSVSDVSINIDKQTGRSKGFAFITIEDARDAADAVKALHKSLLHGREISVDVAHGGGSETGVIIRPKVYSHSKGRHNNRRKHDRKESDVEENRAHQRSRSRSRSRER